MTNTKHTLITSLDHRPPTFPLDKTLDFLVPEDIRRQATSHDAPLVVRPPDIKRVSQPTVASLATAIPRCSRQAILLPTLPDDRSSRRSPAMLDHLAREPASGPVHRHEPPALMNAAYRVGRALVRVRPPDPVLFQLPHLLSACLLRGTFGRHRSSLAAFGLYTTSLLIVC